MLPKKRRIERKYFGQIMSQGKRYNSPSFTLYLAKMDVGNGLPDSKFSFSVSKKVLKRAVDRNKLRRRGYSVISRNLKKIKPGFFVFFLYKKGFEKDYSLLEKEINGLLSSTLVII
ncbi:MAG: hypothetical protein CEO12_267 [Parcubacteria group bacterium Gr01-1014_46]|nr:MAG: hypothetical protein CEO12_267 [Parcubacteria group bacterium Gr01-1014_46]